MASLCIALDVSLKEALALACHLEGKPLVMKVGPSLLMEGGRQFIDELLSMGYEVFLDLKLHDIPNSVGLAVRRAEEMGISYLTLHTLGGEEMLRRAVQEKKNLKLIGVTVLTSHGEEYPSFLGAEGMTIKDLVMRLADTASGCSLDGIVCSTREVKEIKRRYGMLAVVPGIRLETGPGDQKRVSTPAEAARDGADIIVMGREITQSCDPAKVVERVLHEITSSR